MAKVNIVRPGEGEILGSGAQQIRILEGGEHTDHRLGFAEVTIPPGTPSPLQHRHAQHDEGFYVLAGTFRFTVGEDQYDAGPGTWVIVPTGAPHTFANVGDENAVMLNTFTPDLYVQYFRDFKAMIDSGQPVNAETMQPLWKNYATEISKEYAPVKRLPNDRYGGPEVMRLAEFEPPWPGPDEVLVGVGAAAANSLGWKMRNRQMKLMTGRSFPRAMGHDSAGVVAAVGTGVTRLKAGDAVPGRARFRQAGTFAGMVTAPEKTVVLRPVDLSCAQAAALDERERTITSLRFGQGMTRSEIGDHLGISQMQVSHILNRILTGLRTSMLTES